MKGAVETVTFALMLGTSSAVGPAAGSVDAMPARSPGLLAADVTWLRSLATRVSEASSRLAELNAAADKRDAARFEAQMASPDKTAASAPVKPLAVLPGKAATAAGRVPTAHGAVTDPPSAPAVVRSPAQVSWQRARFGELRRLSIQESATGLPAVEVEQAFGSVHVEVTSGWLNATQALVGAQMLVGDASNPCYGDYLKAVAKVFSTDMKVERLVDSEPAVRRAVPDFAAFAEQTPDCKPLLHHTWPQSPADAHSAIEAGLVWWIGRLLTCRASTWEVPASLASPAPPIDRPKELLTAMGLDAADARPAIDLYIAAFHGGCPAR